MSDEATPNPPTENVEVTESKVDTETKEENTEKQQQQTTETKEENNEQQQPKNEYDLPLESSWTFWYSTKPKANEENYESKLRNLGSFNSLAGFRKYANRFL